MLARIAGPTLAPSRFPRWGFLDRYAVDPYLSRALLLVVLGTVAAAGLAEFALLRRDSAGPAARPNSFRDVIEVPHFVIPPPALEVKPFAVRPIAPTVPSRIVPVDDALAPVRTDEQASGSTTSAGPSTTEFGGDTIVPDAAPSTEVLPDILLVVEREPQLLTIEPPAYPEIAREAGLEGTVFVRVLVWMDGTVREATIASGVLGLDEAALAAVRTAIFAPASQQGRPVATWMILPIEFRLH